MPNTIAAVADALVRQSREDAPALDARCAIAARLDSADLHLIELPALDFDERALWSLLDADERAHSSRFVAATDRRRSVAARAFLRLTLSRYLGANPREIPITRASAGRIAVDVELLGARLNASLSASDRSIAVAVAFGAPIGVDIDRVTDERFRPDLAGLVLNQRERRALTSMPTHQQSAWIARNWVTKEATLKAMGCGLAVSPDGIDASVHPVDIRDALFGEWRPIAWQRSWWTRGFAWRNAVGAVTVAAPPRQLRRFEVEFDRLGAAQLPGFT